jgi:hypothetical protein
MSLQGLPDFYQPLRSEGGEILYPYEGGIDHILLPERLEVAERPDGRPEFSLELVRGQNPFLPPASYGVLDLRARPSYRTAEALRLLRDRHPDRMITCARFTGGFLRLRPLGDVGDVPPDFLTPVALSWNGLGMARWILRLSTAGIALLKQSLQSEVLALTAAAEVEMLGVSPRLPLHVRFDPAVLLGGLLTCADERRRLAWESLLAFFRRDLTTLPLEISGRVNDEDRGLLAEALADRVRLRFGAFIPSPQEDAAAYMCLVSVDEVGSGHFEWDLAQPIAVPRVLVLELDALGSAHHLVAREGIQAVLHETVVPPIPTGVLPVSITANLPEHRIGVLAAGVELHAPACPPHRVQAVTEAVELKPPEDSAMLRLKLSPAEPAAYTYTTFVVLQDAGGIVRLNSEARPDSRQHLDLNPDSFPVQFVLIEAGRALLDLAVVHGVCRYPDGGAVVAQTFELTLLQPAIALALPRHATGATLEIEALASDSHRSLRLGPLPAQDLQLDVHSFPEYGSHRVDITCVFDDHQSVVVLDLLPEGRAEKADDITVLHLTPAQPRREWTWLAESPFQAGYCYRRHAAPGEILAPWSAVRSYLEPLEISARALAAGDT